MTELGQLAFFLGKSDALDSQGIRAAQMAEDLADTTPAVLARTFTLARKHMTFFPTVAELLAIYQVESVKHFDRLNTAELRAAEAEREAMREDQRAHPEKYAADLDSEDVKRLAAKLKMPLRAPAVDKRITIPEPRVHECPHCGGHIPEGVADLRGLTAEDLRSIADRRELRKAEAALARTDFAEHIEKEQQA